MTTEGAAQEDVRAGGPCLLSSPRLKAGVTAGSGDGPSSLSSPLPLAGGAGGGSEGPRFRPHPNTDSSTAPNSASAIEAIMP